MFQERPVERTHHDSQADPYAWLRDRDDPRVRAHIEKENNFTDERLAPIRALQEKVRQEILDRVDLDQASVPVRCGIYEYYSRTEQNQPYTIHCRRRAQSGAPEEIVLDENVLANGKRFFALEFLRVSSDHSRCVFGVDTIGDERPLLFVKDLDQEGASVALAGRAVSDAAWANDNRTFFSVQLDDRNRPLRLARHSISLGIGSQPSVSEHVVFEEHDESFRLRLTRTESGRFLVLTSWAHDTTEIQVVSADDPKAPARMLHRRHAGVEAYATHHGQDFYILTNEGARGKKIVAVPAADLLASKRTFLDARPGIEISYVQVFASHLAVCERQEGLSRFRIIDMPSGEGHVVILPESLYSLYPEDNREFETPIFRFGYDSLTTPYSVYDYHMADRRLRLRQRACVKDYDPAAYRSERLLVTTADGVQVPLSLVYRDCAQRDGTRPALLYGYGAYGYCLEPQFSSLRLSLLDRGFIYAIAHVRGGGELGEAWHKQGKGRLKNNSFRDFIACAEHLVRIGYTDPARLAIMGESAGGLLVAAVTNERPDLFAAVVADGPFVDVANTLLDATLPFTVSEWKEWGDPNDPIDLAYLRSYSPYDNVRPQDYPPALVLCSLSDPRVPYWEALKWAERIRAVGANQPEILVKVRMDGGHQGASDRFDQVDEWALIYAFIIRRTLNRASDSAERGSCVA